MKYFLLTLAIMVCFMGVMMAIEEPDYIVESKAKNYEIRSYHPVIVAETRIESDFESAGNQAFRI